MKAERKRAIKTENTVHPRAVVGVSVVMKSSIRCDMMNDMSDGMLCEIWYRFEQTISP